MKLTPQMMSTKIDNERPMGLDALLGHLLDKRIQVRYKLSSKKISEHLSQKKVAENWKCIK